MSQSLLTRRLEEIPAVRKAMIVIYTIALILFVANWSWKTLPPTSAVITL